MTIARLLVRLHPTAVRDRWGAELEQQVIEAGPRSWANTVLGAASLWLHPALWPEPTTEHRRRALATLAFIITVLTGLLLRATGNQFLGATPQQLGSSGWLLLVFLGIIAATPMPRARPSALVHLAVVTVRTLGVPVVAFLAMFVAANSGLVDHPTGVVHVILISCYWAILVFAGARTCMLIARTRGDTSAPSVGRLRVALSLIGSGLALAVCQLLAAMAETRPSVAGVATAITLMSFVAIVAATAHDLHTARR